MYGHVHILFNDCMLHYKVCARRNENKKTQQLLYFCIFCIYQPEGNVKKFVTDICRFHAVIANLKLTRYFEYYLLFGCAILRCASLLRASYLIIIFFYLGVSMAHLTRSNDHAKRLYNNLMSNYQRMIRPVKNSSDILTIKLGLKLSQLIGIVSRRNTHTDSILQDLAISRCREQCAKCPCTCWSSAVLCGVR